MIVYHIPILVGKSPRISFSQYPNPKYCLSLITVFVLLSWYSHISRSIFFPSLHFRRLDEQLVWVKLRYPKKIACTIIYYHHLSYTCLPIMVPPKKSTVPNMSLTSLTYLKRPLRMNVSPLHPILKLKKSAGILKDFIGHLPETVVLWCVIYDALLLSTI